MSIAELYSLFKEHPVVTTDSRSCPEGSIFFALKGGNFNGNKFAKHALEKGCAYAVIDEAEYYEEGKKLILVQDVLKALQDLANYHRNRLGTKIIGITGTNGKTTTKELIAAVLMKKFNVLYTQGNLNNHIGVPLTLLRITPAHDIAVVEMGANHPGEIAQLASIAEPDYGIITNVGMAHLEGFGSFEGVIKTKGELYDFLRTRANSSVFINQNNSYLTAIANGLNLVRYGKPEEGSSLFIKGNLLACDPFLRFTWSDNQGEHEVHTQLIGSYNLENALAAVTIGYYFEIAPSLINQALADYTPQNNRSQLTITAHNKLIVDAYNANPTSMKAALENFHQMRVSPKMAILGDMRELGESSAEEHQKIIAMINQCQLGEVWLVGDEFLHTTHTQRTFANVQEVSEELAQNPLKNCYILIKGSNGINLSKLVELL